MRRPLRRSRPGAVGDTARRLSLALALLLPLGARPAAARATSLPGQVPSAATQAPAATTTQALPDSALDAETRALAEQLRCPVCQGVSIEASPTDLAKEMRSLVREQLAAGRTPDQVKAYFVSKYGEWILLAPKAKGFNLTVYLLPFVALLAGAAVIALAVRRWTRAPGGNGADDVAESGVAVGEERETPVRR